VSDFRLVPAPTVKALVLCSQVPQELGRAALDAMLNLPNAQHAEGFSRTFGQQPIGYTPAFGARAPTAQQVVSRILPKHLEDRGGDSDNLTLPLGRNDNLPVPSTPSNTAGGSTSLPTICLSPSRSRHSQANQAASTLEDTSSPVPEQP
jgi:hypothetical protein